MTVLIPAYEPDHRLLELIANLQRMDSSMHIVVVDDGSGEAYRDLFNIACAAGCTVLIHPTNQGKGLALKTGFHHLIEIGSTEGVVCADSDGQHLPSDIMRIIAAVDEHPNELILGCRYFTGKVPFRSRFGNSATRMVYTLTTGCRIQDTQTGLRGFSASMLDWLCQIPGERFEYEMNMLLAVQEEGIRMYEVPIDTIYLEQNKSSHFRPIADSVKVYAPIVKFCSSSVLSALLDFVLLFLLQLATGSLLVSVAGARVGSSVFNYSMNRRFVFNKKQKPSVLSSAPKYFALVVLILMFNYGFMYLYNESLGLPLIVAKLLTEGTLFVFSFWSQRQFVFQAERLTGSSASRMRKHAS
ncbi:bifunctional glycosyltransferase family 2/GtrA family protein [Paenibacillus sp. OV219]|uniref:bifunctional glycosyltransferase family 2/GtrA family protein n=1 Tax=Paenibacillus sp. OV219 TaxID=1884377 RepID=UPI0008CBBDF1|nr:bifunctional glycosyltransferase family 2/GtrA family protein [Paenibacillus sp. OV219]SEM55899.1 Putative flippase GtrA (transmembrane translocase of bactoprenol-linked glucose) [Paenibacillus sp. OV219]